ncbi:MAG: hypothetical protein MUF58_09485 [Arcicella sp.]|jgi:hypothetical protein|nr:hypothetical protein [Arcicella sp.]
MTTLALEINTRQHLEMMLSLAKKLKIKSRVFENDLMTPYEKTINEDTMTLNQLTEHLDNIADNDETMSYEEFKKRLREWK